MSSTEAISLSMEWLTGAVTLPEPERAEALRYADNWAWHAAYRLCSAVCAGRVTA